ncbi:hypothetical protein [Paucibacter soli]|uniref:hypothetical protein n=1 Tax=Paucibacter soli TaxID=3133433 RepID=UPI003094B32A
MKHLSTPVSGLLAAAAMTIFTGAAAAADSGTKDLNRVEVSGQKRDEMLRTDVRKVCPGIAAKLQEELGGAWWRVEEPAQVQVQFRLQGEQMHGVRASTRQSDYRQAVRRAVHRLDCGNDNADDQLFAFVIEFKAPDEQSEQRSTVALLMP